MKNNRIGPSHRQEIRASENHEANSKQALTSAGGNDDNDDFTIDAQDLHIIMIQGMTSSRIRPRNPHNVEDLATKLKSSIDHGISNESEASIELRRKQFGSNGMVPKHIKSYAVFIVGTARDPLLICLAIVAIITLCLLFIPRRTKTVITAVANNSTLPPTTKAIPTTLHSSSSPSTSLTTPLAGFPESSAANLSTTERLFNLTSSLPVLFNQSTSTPGDTETPSPFQSIENSTTKLSVAKGYVNKSSEVTLEPSCDSYYAWVGSVVVIVGIIIIVLLDSGLDYYASKEIRKLQSQISDRTRIRAVRNGQIVTLHLYDIVVGDVCLIKAGDFMPASGILIASVKDIQVDEALSNSGVRTVVKKSPTSDPYLFANTYIVSGEGKMLVTMVGTVPKPIFRYFTKVFRLSDIVGTLGCSISFIIFVILAIRLMAVNYGWSHFYLFYFSKFALLGVAMASVAFPECVYLAAQLAMLFAIRHKMYQFYEAKLGNGSSYVNGAMVMDEYGNTTLDVTTSSSPSLETGRPYLIVRSVCDSVGKYIQFLLVIILVIIFTVLVFSVATGHPPFNALHIVWFHIIFSIIPSLTLTADAPKQKAKKAGNDKREDQVITPKMFRFIVSSSIYQIVILVVILFLSPEFLSFNTSKQCSHENLRTPDDSEKCMAPTDDRLSLEDAECPNVYYTFFVNCFAWMNFANLINARCINGEHNVLAGIHKNVYFVIAFAATVVVHSLLLQLVTWIFHTVPLTSMQWAICLAVAGGQLICYQLFCFIPVDRFAHWLFIKVEKHNNGGGSSTSVSNQVPSEDTEMSELYITQRRLSISSK